MMPERDVVCGLPVDPARSAHTSDYLGQIYYFCSDRCRQQFEAAPEVYVGHETGSTGATPADSQA